VGLGLTEDGGAHEGGEEALKQIRTLLAPFVLRRVKTQVGGLISSMRLKIYIYLSSMCEVYCFLLYVG
jgi:SNF2 family DNA or RNA helicase